MYAPLFSTIGSSTLSKIPGVTAGSINISFECLGNVNKVTVWYLLQRLENVSPEDYYPLIENRFVTNILANILWNFTYFISTFYFIILHFVCPHFPRMLLFQTFFLLKLIISDMFEYHFSSTSLTKTQSSTELVAVAKLPLVIREKDVEYQVWIMASRSPQWCRKVLCHSSNVHDKALKEQQNIIPKLKFIFRSIICYKDIESNNALILNHGCSHILWHDLLSIISIWLNTYAVYCSINS